MAQDGWAGVARAFQEFSKMRGPDSNSFGRHGYPQALLRVSTRTERNPM